MYFHAIMNYNSEKSVYSNGEKCMLLESLCGDNNIQLVWEAVLADPMVIDTANVVDC